jgi:hypothetical protein
MRKLYQALGLIALLLHTGLLASAEMAPEAQRLAKDLDGMNVDRLWLSRHRVHWKTGEPYGPAPTDGKSHTHCSAFVAAFCYRHGLYILRPPEHSTTFLANAQYDWLQSDAGQKAGWQPVLGPMEAQRLANQGMVVVAAFKESDPKKHGHIAIVRPSTKSDSAILAEGPQIIQAGMDNYQSASLQEGFKHHRGAWPTGQIRFFSHDLKSNKP